MPDRGVEVGVPDGAGDVVVPVGAGNVVVPVGAGVVAVPQEKAIKQSTRAIGTRARQEFGNGSSTAGFCRCRSVAVVEPPSIKPNVLIQKGF